MGLIPLSVKLCHLIQLQSYNHAKSVGRFSFACLFFHSSMEAVKRRSFICMSDTPFFHSSTNNNNHLTWLYLSSSAQPVISPRDYPCIYPSFHPQLFHDELISPSLPVVQVTRMTQENLLTGSPCPSGLIGPQHPVRRDQYIIPSVTSLACLPPLPPPASLCFHFIIISHSGSMQANRRTVNHTTIRAASNLLVDSISFTTASEWNTNDNEI